MSLALQPLAAREPTQQAADLSNGPETSYTEASQLPSTSTTTATTSTRTSTTSHDTYDDCIFDEFYQDSEEDDNNDHDDDADMDVIVKTATVATLAPPSLPSKSRLRASRLFDDLHLKLRASIEAHQILEAQELLQTTATATGGEAGANPHEVYMSSEEEASSSADDFSDYDYDYDSAHGDDDDDDPASPQSSRRRSYEDTAKVVAVVFVGKPSLVDLPAPSAAAAAVRRSSSSTTTNNNSTPTLLPYSRRESLLCAPPARPSSSMSSFSSHFARKSSGSGASLLSSLLHKQQQQRHQHQHQHQPSFLSIDPYANGSTYSLATTHEEERHHDDDDRDSSSNNSSPTKALGASLFRGVSKTLTLARKRSRPLLRESFADRSRSRDSLASITVTAPSPPAKDLVPRPLTVAPKPPPPPQQQQQEPTRPQTPPPRAPSTPVTYNEIMRSARRNSQQQLRSPPPPRASAVAQPGSPESPVSEAKRSLLAGLAARRRANKAAARMI